MTRSFRPDPLAPGTIERLVDLASRAPSAGKTQGWHLVVLEGDDTARFWDLTLPAERRATFRWQRLLDAPVIALPFADPSAYVARYAEPDKASTGLGAGADAWPTPYWTVDASMALMTFLLAAEDEGLGALLFGVFRGEAELRAELGAPAHLQLLGAVALGHPMDTIQTESLPTGRDASLDDAADDPSGGRGRSAARPRRTPSEIVRRDGFHAG